MKQLLRRSYIQVIILALVIFAAYFPVITSHRKVDPDAQYILPTLVNISNVGEYISLMTNLKTMDVQPLRDASLLWDQYLYTHLGMNTFAFQNFLWWIACCFLVLQVLKKVFPEEDEIKLFIVTVGFSIYPLFSSTVPWGMARKHILSFFFILFATTKLTESPVEISNKNKLQITIAYMLGMMSQPIALLWPFWAFLFVWFNRPQLKSSFMKILPGLLFIFAATLLWNNHYYNNSSVFLSIFPNKTRGLFNFGGQLLALGHYIYTIFAPYTLSFLYTLGHWTTLAGLAVIAVFAIVQFKFNSKESYVWVAYILFPLATVLTMPEVLQDTYLLLPAVGTLIVVIFLLKKLPAQYFKIIFVLIPVWFFISFQRGQLWLDIEAMTDSNFQNAPTCVTAMNSVRIRYSSAHAADPDALAYLSDYECFSTTTHSQHNLEQAKYLQSQILYFNEAIPLSDRVQALREGHARNNVFATINLTGLLIKQGKGAEALPYLEQVMTILKEFPTAFYDVVIEKTILPFCAEKQNTECLRILKRFGEEKDLPYN